MLKRITLFLLVLLVSLSLFVPVSFASDLDDFIVTPMWTYIHLVECGLNIDSGGQAAMVSYMNCYQGTVDKIVMNNYLQRYVNGSWTTVASWSKTTYGTSAEWLKSYYVTSGYLYRLRTYFYAYYGSSIIETTSLTSGIDSY